MGFPFVPKLETLNGVMAIILHYLAEVLGATYVRSG